MRGYARRFRPVRPTAQWMAELREGEAYVGPSAP
jgi:hypothetical protein